VDVTSNLAVLQHLCVHANLPPCYDIHHDSPPWGQTGTDATAWKWSDTARWLAVVVSKPPADHINGDNMPFGRIYIRSGTVDPKVGTGWCLRA
jgi:hypothetical protein